MQKGGNFKLLKPQDVRAIRAEYQLDITGKVITAPNVIELAKRYGVSQETIRNIAKRKTYGWIHD